MVQEGSHGLHTQSSGNLWMCENAPHRHWPSLSTGMGTVKLHMGLVSLSFSERGNLWGTHFLLPRANNNKGENPGRQAAYRVSSLSPGLQSVPIRERVGPHTLLSELTAGLDPLHLPVDTLAMLPVLRAVPPPGLHHPLPPVPIQDGQDLPGALWERLGPRAITSEGWVPRGLPNLPLRFHGHWPAGLQSCGIFHT